MIESELEHKRKLELNRLRIDMASIIYLIEEMIYNDYDNKKLKELEHQYFILRIRHKNILLHQYHRLIYPL